MMRSSRVVCYAALICLAAGCRTPQHVPPAPVQPPARPAPNVPDWTLQTPQSPTAIYAVATWPKTLFQHDAIEKAKANARAELAKTLQVKVSGVLVDWQSSSTSTFAGQGHAEDFIASMSKETMDVAMSGSQIVTVWVDRLGQVSQRGTVWALAKMDKSSLAEQLLNTAKTVKAQMSAEDKVNMEEQAAKAFEDLDKRLEKIE